MPALEIWIAYAMGGDDSDLLATDRDTIKALAEREFIDYFGKPIRWKESLSGNENIFFGEFNESAYQTRVICAAKVPVMGPDDLKEGA